MSAKLLFLSSTVPAPSEVSLYRVFMRSIYPGGSSCLRIIALLLIIVAHATVAEAFPDTTRVYSPQGAPSLWVTLDDSSRVYLLESNGDTTRPITISAGFEVTMSYDSLCLVTYTATEFRKNGQRLRLPTWKKGMFVNAHPAVLNTNNSTGSFTAHTGDTISFYREFKWFNPNTRFQDTANYYSLDTLQYVAELVRASDSVVVAVIDSLGVLPRVPAGRPVLYGTRPIMSNVVYTVPSSLNNAQIFVRLHLYHKGAGPYWFSRKDIFTVGLSARLQDTVWQGFLALMGAMSPKYAPGELEISGTKAIRLDVHHTASDPRVVVVDFMPDRNGGTTVVGIYDLQGNRIFMPFMASAAVGDQQTPYRFDSPGAYFIVLLHEGRIVKTAKVIVE